jgi:hypothetical protein
MSLACTNIRDVEHDWFANLTELRETSYDATRGEMVVEGDELDSVVNWERYGIGYLSMPRLAKVRSSVDVPARQRSVVRCLTGEARAMHADPDLEGRCVRSPRSSTCWISARPSRPGRGDVGLPSGGGGARRDGRCRTVGLGPDATGPDLPVIGEDTRQLSLF